MSKLRSHLNIPPLFAMLVVMSLILLVPLGFYAAIGIREWQSGGSPYAALTGRYFWAVGLGRCVGGVLLAILLLCWRRPTAIAITITAVWLAGPPVTFLWNGITVLAASAGQSSWAGDPLVGVVTASAYPTFVTIALLVPSSVRRAFGL